MEILIFQAGEQLGPFTEAQVRQYLGAGMISPSDLAIYQGMEKWQALDQVLANLPPPTDELGAILPDVPPADSPAAAPPAPELEQPFIMQPTSSETVESTASPPSPPDPILSLITSQKTKRKPGKIVIQPIVPLEVTATLLQKKARTGKTALTLEPLRPTTALPPVAGFVPKEKKPGKTLIRTGQVSLGAPPEKPATTPAPISTPIPPAATVTPPVLAKEPSPPSQFTSTSLLPEKTKGPAQEKTGLERLPREVIYAGAAMAFVIACVMIAFVYLIFAHDKTPAAANPENAPPPPTEHTQVQPTPPAAPATPQTAAEYSDRGFARQSKGDLDGAISDYDTALDLDSKNSEAYYRRGLALESKGNWNGAMADYNTVLSLNSNNADAFSNRGYVKQALGDLDGALADYTQALKLNPKISAAYFNEGLIEIQKGAYDSAITAFNQALALDPNMPLAYYNRAGAKMTEGNPDGAIADYTQALALDPKIARAYSERGLARQTKGDLDGALADYSQALDLDPTITLAFFKRSQIKLLKGDLEGALADSSIVLLADPKNAQAYYDRGIARIGKSYLDDAATDLKQFIALAPHDNAADTARLFLWLISTEENPQGGADLDLSTAVQNDWNSPPEELTSKTAAFLLGHLKERDFIANAASPDQSLEPGQYCKVWYFAGMKRLLKGDMKTAISYFQKCLATNQRDLCETLFAQAELQALGQNREVAAKPAEQ